MDWAVFSDLVEIMVGKVFANSFGDFSRHIVIPRPTLRFCLRHIDFVISTFRWSTVCHSYSCDLLLEVLVLRCDVVIYLVKFTMIAAELSNTI